MFHRTTQFQSVPLLNFRIELNLAFPRPNQAITSTILFFLISDAFCLQQILLLSVRKARDMARVSDKHGALSAILETTFAESYSGV